MAPWFAISQPRLSSVLTWSQLSLPPPVPIVLEFIAATPTTPLAERMGIQVVNTSLFPSSKTIDMSTGTVGVGLGVGVSLAADVTAGMKVAVALGVGADVAVDVGVDITPTLGLQAKRTRIMGRQM